jgi:hypothetical protein
MDKIMLFKDSVLKIFYRSKYEKEYELQELVKENPNIVELKSIFDTPLLIIGRETLRIDVLGITLYGVPVIIECKRKENPDMRYLIAQVFEYASILKTKTFEELDSFSREYFKGEKCKETKYKNKTLLEALNILIGEHPEYDNMGDDDMQNIVYNNLKNGNFFLLVVADEIDEKTRRTIDFLNSKLNDIRIEIVEIKKFSENDIFILVPDHINPDEHIRLKSSKKVGKITLEEMKSKGSGKQKEIVNKIIDAWENNEDRYIEMGTTGLSMRYNDYSIFWLFIDKIKIANPLKKQLAKNGKTSEFSDDLEKILKKYFKDLIIETEKIDINDINKFIEDVCNNLKKL